MIPHCCVINCPADAEWEIHTVRDDGGIAGPDIYCDETQSCTTHVGALLGYQPEALNPEELLWHVYPIEAIAARDQK